MQNKATHPPFGRGLFLWRANELSLKPRGRPAGRNHPAPERLSDLVIRNAVNDMLV
jgi:hypothetical protein